MINQYSKEFEEKNKCNNFRYFVIANKMDKNVGMEQNNTYPLENIEYLSVFDESLNVGQICQKIWDKARYFDIKTTSNFKIPY